MYKIVFTKGDMEKVIKEINSLELAKEAKKQYEKLPEYSDGLVTIEQGEGKIRKIVG